MRNGIIDTIQLITSIDNDVDKLSVCMKDLDSYILFGKLNDYLSFIDKEVEFNTRWDIINGIKEEVINTIAVKSIIQSVIPDINLGVDELELSSLIPDNSKAINVITFDKDSLKTNDIALAQIILILNYKDGKSKVTRWKDFQCLDVNSKVFNLRLFTNSDEVDEFSKNAQGKYVMVDIKNTTYGLQVYKDMSIYEEEVKVPSEVLLSTLKLKMYISKDNELESYVEKYDMINKLKGIMYFEPGYHIVEIVAELMIISTVCRIFETYDRKLLYRAAFASRGYLMKTNTKLSNTLINYHNIITSDLKTDLDLIRLLDTNLPIEEGDINKQAFLSIRKIVTSLMRGKRGLYEKNIINDYINTIDSQYSGLFQRGIIDLD
jgi:hypothetical protein